MDNLVNLVKNMSLDEGLNFNLEETAADGNQNQSAVPRNLSVTAIYEGQPAADGHRRTFSLPGETNCLKLVNENAAKKDVNPEGGEGRSKRSRNFTPKGWHTRLIFSVKEEA